MVKRPVRSPPKDTPQSGAGDWQLARLASWGQPAAQPSCSNSPTRVCSQMSIVIFPLLSVVASQATKTNAASSEGGRGWSAARVTAIFTSKMLARFRALAQNQARGGGWRLNVFADKELHPPHARQQASPAFSSDPINEQSWERSQAASAPPCNASKWVLWRCNPPCVVAFWMHNVPWHANQPSQARPQGRDRSSHRLGLCRPSHLPFFQLSGNGSPSKQSTQHQSQSKIHSQTATQSAPHCTLVKHAKDPGISTFSLKKMGKLVSFCGGPS